MIQEIFRPNLLKQDTEDCEICPIILEGKFEMVAKCVPRPILGRVNFFDDAFTRIYPMSTASCHYGFVPVRDDIKVVLLYERSISN